MIQSVADATAIQLIYYSAYRLLYKMRSKLLKVYCKSLQIEKVYLAMQLSENIVIITVKLGSI